MSTYNHLLKVTNWFVDDTDEGQCSLVKRDEVTSYYSDTNVLTLSLSVRTDKNQIGCLNLP